MSSTPPRPAPASSFPSEKTTCKRKVCFKVDELEQMHELKLPCPAFKPIEDALVVEMKKAKLEPKTELANALSQVTRARVLPAFIAASRSVSEAEDVISQESKAKEESRLDRLKRAKKYVDDRMESEHHKREIRYEMCDVSPQGSQNSVGARYSQDSQASGDEPPLLRSIVFDIIDTLDEKRLQQLFPFGNTMMAIRLAEDHRRVRIATPFLDADLQLLGALVEEAIAVLDGEGGVQSTPLRAPTLDANMNLSGVETSEEVAFMRGMSSHGGRAMSLGAYLQERGFVSTDEAAMLRAPADDKAPDGDSESISRTFS